MKIDYDPMLFSVLEREHAEKPFESVASPSDLHMTYESVVRDGVRGFAGSGDQRLLNLELDNDDTWLLNELTALELASAR